MCAQRAGYRKEHRPTAVYSTIETLLPDARCPCAPETNTPRVHVGKLVELYVYGTRGAACAVDEVRFVCPAAPKCERLMCALASIGRTRPRSQALPTIPPTHCRWGPPGIKREGWVNIVQKAA